MHKVHRTSILIRLCAPVSVSWVSRLHCYYHPWKVKGRACLEVHGLGLVASFLLRLVGGLRSCAKVGNKLICRKTLVSNLFFSYPTCPETKDSDKNLLYVD